MAEPLKNLIDAALVRAAGGHLARAWPAFPRGRFESIALDGLDALEFKARADRVASALEATLPADFDTAAALIETALGPPAPADGSAETTAGDAGLGGWMVWPLGSFVARRGIEHPERALATLHALTQRFSAEFAIRPFIARHPALVFETLGRWAHDPSAHVRRLVSEGSRPRLPWGERLRALVADPSPALPLLEALQDDTSETVRRSVANHLNDIAKDHPEIVVAWLERHLPGAPPARVQLLRHACRTLVKAGDARVLAAFGAGTPLGGDATLALAPRRIVLGGAVQLAATLRSTARRPQTLVVDYAVHHVKASGATAPKVFKGWSLDLAPGETRRLVRRHAVRPITTRRYHAGRHLVELRVNGRVVAAATFELKLA